MYDGKYSYPKTDIAVFLKRIVYSNKNMVDLHSIGTDSQALVCLTPCCKQSEPSDDLPFSWELPDRKNAAATTGEGVTITKRPGDLFLHRELGKEPGRELSAGNYTRNVPDKNSLVQSFYILGYTSSSPPGKKTEI